MRLSFSFYHQFTIQRYNMSELDNAIKKINDSANRADNTTTFYDNVVSGGKDDVYVNPNNNKSSKSVKGILDEAYQADKPDFTEFVDQCKAEVVNATDQADIATTQAAAAAHSASEASRIAGLDTLASGVGVLSPRYDTPDFKCSFNDGIEIEHGYGTRNTHGNRAIDFSRASAATSINKSGQLVTLAENEPAIESSGIALFHSLTNLATHSEDFTAWNKNGACTVTGGQLDPFGGNKAAKVVAESANSGVYTLGLITSGDNSYSVWAKGTDGQGLRFGSNVGNTITLINEWERYTIYLENRGAMTIYADSNDQEFEIYGAQCLRGNIPNAPYIPTTDTAVTRAADVSKVTSVNNLPAAGKPWYCVIDVDFGDVVNNGAIREILRTQDSGVYFRFFKPDSGGQLGFGFKEGGGINYIFSDSKARLIPFYDGHSIGIYSNSVLLGSAGISNANYNLQDIFIGSDNGTNHLNGHIKNLIIKHGIMTADLAKAYGAYPDA